MTKYKKIVFDKESKTAKIEKFHPSEPQVNEALVDVFYSGVNYKDALGLTGRGAIFKTSPVIPGIDFSGIALTGKYKNQKVIGQGMGFGESFDGGYTQRLCCEENLLIPLEDSLSLKEAMVLGTAGFTAALAVHRMLQNGQTKDKGPILISGATGGVGSFAVQIFKSLGFEVHVVTHRMKHEGYLKSLGADQVLNYEESFSLDKVKPLQSVEWGGVVDNLGGDFLEKTLPQVALWGNVASIGLAKKAVFSTTVMPFILRGVSLLGISSANCSMKLRKTLWTKLSKEWKPSLLLELVNQELSLEEVLDSSHKILDHKSQPGRALINLKA